MCMRSSRWAWWMAALPLATLLGCGGGGGRDVEKLLGDLMSTSPRARARAESNLSEHGRALLKPLSALVTGEEAAKLDLRVDWHTLRVPAARALGVIADKASLARSEAEVAAKPLLTALHGQDMPLRIEAAKALGRFAQLSGPANDLILALREDVPELNQAVIDSLGRNSLRSIGRLVLAEEPVNVAAGQHDWDRLLSHLNSTDDDIRLETVRELAGLNEPRAATLLLDRLATEKSSDVRYAALRVCVADPRAAGDEAFGQKLRGDLKTLFAKDEDSRVVLLAAQSLARRDAALVGPFLGRLEVARRTCEEELLAIAGNPERRYDDATRSDAIAALRLVPSPTRDQLLARMLGPAAGESARIRRAAASVLAASQAPEAVQALQGAMQDSDSIVKLIAAQALGRRGNLDAVRYLIDLLSHKEAKIRTPAADALGTLGAKALDVLIGELDKSLGSSAELATWEVPLAALQRKESLSAEERSERSRLERAVADYQRRAAGRDEKLIAWGLVTALGHIAGGLGPEGEPALQAIARAGQCHYADVRRAAALALGGLKSDKAVRPLALALADSDRSVVWHAAASLEKHSAAAVSALRAVLTDPATPADSPALAAAATSLARLGDAASLKPIVERLAAAKGESRSSFVWGLGELLKRYPDAPEAAAARQALTAASQRTDDPDAARLARSALAQSRAGGDEKK